MQNKVFKIVADQAANNKKAFGSEIECDELVRMTKDLLEQQKKDDLQTKQLAWQKEYEKERQRMICVDTEVDNNKKRKRDDVLLEEFNEDDYEEDFTDNTNVGDDTLDDVNNLNFCELMDDIFEDEEISKCIR